MATAMKKVEKIRQIVRLKQLVMRWKFMSLRRSVVSYDNSIALPPLGLNRRIPSGFLAVYVGPERIRFVIPARFVNLPVFVGLLKKAEEELGFQSNGGLVLPCEVVFFKEMLRFLEKDESRFGRLGLDELLKVVSEVGFVDSCKDSARNAGAKNSGCHAFTPLLQR
ncbi:auxin-responsive protein SAUR50-like [Pyrus x bretschneideri]|uniref:auxin-responsive protein SAUR50-like n=1 Tax=Pyrus x bretschneideri TaxID=225117 RepID=UPI000511460E|nr:auxin-responsive protein SAUR50-like [Pyrus x bretschneideri]